MDDKIKLSVGIFITIALAMGGTYFIGEDTYYCESRDMVGICEKLSDGLGTRCYFNETYKTCSEGWKLLEGFTEPDMDYAEKVDVMANGEWYSCETANGTAQSYTNCVSESNKFAYMGELI